MLRWLKPSTWLKLETNERKNIALWMMFGACVIFTIYASIGLWLVSANLKYVLILAAIAHVQIFSIMCGFIAQLVKRRISAGRDGVSISDEGTFSEEKKPVVEQQTAQEEPTT